MTPNPFIGNDPVLRFYFENLHLGPLMALVLSILFLILLPTIWTYYNGSWRDEDIQVPDEYKDPRQGHGFLRIYNLYLLFLPILNFTIFNYYEDVHTYTQILIKVGMQFDVPQKEVLDNFFEPFEKLWSSIPLLLALLTGIITFYIFTRRGGQFETQSGKIVPKTDWLYKNGKARRICYIFSFITHLVQLTIIVGWLTRHLILSYLCYRQLFHSQELGATLLPFHSDGMFGLTSFEHMARSTSYVFASIGLVVVSWVLGMISTLGGWRNAVWNLGISLAIIFYIIFAPLGVAITLEPAHAKIVATKLETLGTIREQIEINSQLISQALKGRGEGELTLSKLWEEHNTLSSIYKKISEMPDWPLRMITVWKVLGNLFLPILLPIIVNIFSAKVTSESSEK